MFAPVVVPNFNEPQDKELARFHIVAASVIKKVYPVVICRREGGESRRFALYAKTNLKLAGSIAKGD
jgi:hypothetical protein